MVIRDKAESEKIEILLKLYSLASEKERFFFARFYDNLKFYWSIVSFMFSGLSVGVFKVESVHECMLLLVIPVALYAVTLFFEETVVRNYRGFLEAVVDKAKIEALLGLDKCFIPETSEYWQGDSFLNSRYLDDRKKFKNSKEFQAYVINKTGVSKIWKRFFLLAKLMSVVIEVYLLIYLIMLWLKS